MPGDNRSRPLRMLVVGCGSIGRRHIQNLARLGAGEALAYDVSPEALRAAECDLKIETVDSLDRAWAWQPDIALIATSTDTHVALALQAAEHGCHLFVEKPLSYRMDDVEKLCSLAAERQLVTMVGCNMRFHPGPAKVKRLIDENVIGQVIAARIQTGSYLPGWRAGQDYTRSYSASPMSGGVILDCIHEIDLALWYLGPAKVLAAAHLPARSIGLETDGVAEIMLLHASGVLSTVHLNFVQRDYRRTCQVIGTQGTIYWDFGERSVCLYGEEGKLEETYLEPPGWQINQMYVDELAHFLNCVRQGVSTTNPLDGGQAALAVALAARQAQFKVVE